MFILKIYLILIFASCCVGSYSQNQINNLVHISGYVTAPWGELGEVKVFGSGARKAILLPGWGFDWSIFKDFIDTHKQEFTMYAVTLPGFGNTHAPPMPEQPESYKDLYWTNGIIRGLINLIDREKMNDPVLISYFTYSNLIAMRLALDYPDKIGNVIIISGMAKFTANYPSYEPRNLNERINFVENILSKQWFKTVSKQTWDNGNFARGTFSKDSVKTLRHWNMMSSVPIPVMVRYLCEYYCTDTSLEYANLKVPTLVVVPSFTGKVFSGNPYLASFFHYSWIGALSGSPQIQMVTFSDTQAFIIDDQPAKLYALIQEFLDGMLKPFQALR